MSKALGIVSLFLSLASAVSLSLGILTPEVIRKAGERFAKYVFSKPPGTFFSAAHSKIFDTEPHFHSSEMRSHVGGSDHA